MGGERSSPSLLALLRHSGVVDEICRFYQFSPTLPTNQPGLSSARQLPAGMVFSAEFITAEGGKRSSLSGVFRLTPYRRPCRFRPTVKSRLHHASVMLARRALYFRINIFARARPIEISRNPADITRDPTRPTSRN